MSRGRLFAAALTLAFGALACADGEEVVAPDGPGDVRLSAHVTERPIGDDPDATADVVGCEAEPRTDTECRVTGETDYLAVYTTDPLLVDALGSLRTHADLAFGRLNAFGTDTVPVGPGPAPARGRAVQSTSGDSELQAYLQERGLVPTDTVPVGPFTYVVEDALGERIAAALVLSVDDLIHKGVLIRSPSDATESLIMWTRGEYDGLKVLTAFPPTDTVPVGPVGARR